LAAQIKTKAAESLESIGRVLTKGYYLCRTRSNSSCTHPCLQLQRKAQRGKRAAQQTVSNDKACTSALQAGESTTTSGNSLCAAA